MQPADSVPLLELRNLVTTFRTDRGTFRAVDDVSLSIRARRTLALVGESGSGKSVTALSVIRLVPRANGRITAGQVLYKGADLLKLSRKQMHDVRGNEISMIFQEPMTALNPVYTIGQQIAEVFRIHRGYDQRTARAEAIRSLEDVHIPDPERRVDEYPLQMSGGMLQRVLIAMALACEPSVLIADEPTTALDVTIQAQILNLMTQLQDKHATAILLITHDLGVVAETADDVAIMYAGRIVEQGTVEAIFSAPSHPYTKALMASIPSLEDDKRRPLNTIVGRVPGLGEFSEGCAFRNRCVHAGVLCQREQPALAAVAGGQQVACHWAAGRLPA